MLQSGGIHSVEIVFLVLLLFVVLFAALARLLISGSIPSAGAGALRLGYLIVAGLAIGLLVGLVVVWFERRIDDGPIEIVISILTPYAVYLAAESVRASGVLAVVASGLYLSRKSSQFFSATVRLQAWAVWESLTF